MEQSSRLQIQISLNPSGAFLFALHPDRIGYREINGLRGSVPCSWKCRCGASRRRIAHTALPVVQEALTQSVARLFSHIVLFPRQLDRVVTCSLALLFLTFLLFFAKAPQGVFTSESIFLLC